MEASLQPLIGLYRPHNLEGLYYGPDVVRDQIRSVLPSETTKVFIITGNSLATTTPLIADLETLLGPETHAGTFSGIKQHAGAAELEKLTDLVTQNSAIDTIISVGGGSPIDSAKAIIFRVHQKTQKWLTHITIPTTLSAAECTVIAGYTGYDGVKTSVSHPKLYPAYIFYDPKFGLHTPPRLFLSTGIRALDHAVEIQYHPCATKMPTRMMTLSSISELFRLLPQYKTDPKNEDVITGLFLAAYASLGFLGQNLVPALMLSHTLGYALGSPYAIPHGITSCITLGGVVKLVARVKKVYAQNLAAILPHIGEKQSGNNIQDSDRVGDRILQLVGLLGLQTTLKEHNVGMDQFDIITARSLQLHPGKEVLPQDKELFNSVREFVRSLW